MDINLIEIMSNIELRDKVKPDWMSGSQYEDIVIKMYNHGVRSAICLRYLLALYITVLSVISKVTVARG